MTDYDYYEEVKYFLSKFGTLGVSTMLDIPSDELKRLVKEEKLTTNQRITINSLIRENWELMQEYRKGRIWK